MSDTAKMTDLEITRLCAEAMGYTICGAQEPSTVFYPHPNGSAVICVYNPLHDDAPAMALVKKFHLHIGKTLRTPDDLRGKWIVSNTDKWVSEPTSDLNRAICECVAKMQAAASNTAKSAAGGE